VFVVFFETLLIDVPSDTSGDPLGGLNWSERSNDTGVSSDLSGV
jgi:hypothetical protein